MQTQNIFNIDIPTGWTRVKVPGTVNAGTWQVMFDSVLYDEKGFTPYNPKGSRTSLAEYIWRINTDFNVRHLGLEIAPYGVLMYVLQHPQSNELLYKSLVGKTILTGSGIIPQVHRLNRYSYYIGKPYVTYDSRGFHFDSFDLESPIRQIACSDHHYVSDFAINHFESDLDISKLESKLGRETMWKPLPNEPSIRARSPVLVMNSKIQNSFIGVGTFKSELHGKLFPVAIGNLNPETTSSVSVRLASKLED